MVVQMENVGAKSVVAVDHVPRICEPRSGLSVDSETLDGVNAPHPDDPVRPNTGK